VTIADDSRPRLVSWARLRRDAVSGETLLLYPEKGLALSETGASIVELCDGTRSVREIAETLAGRYQASPQDLRSDVQDFLAALALRGLLRAEGSTS